MNENPNHENLLVRKYKNPINCWVDVNVKLEWSYKQFTDVTKSTLKQWKVQDFTFC